MNTAFERMKPNRKITRFYILFSGCPKGKKKIKKGPLKIRSINGDLEIQFSY